MELSVICLPVVTSSTLNTLVSLYLGEDKGNTFLYFRLDRVLVNLAWSDCFSTGRCHYLNFDTSDHIPVLTVFDSAKRRRNRQFRYDRRLKDNAEVTNMIAKVGNADSSLSLDAKLYLCRKAISTWTRKQSFNSKETINKLNLSLEATMVDPNEDCIFKFQATYIIQGGRRVLASTQ